MELNPLRPYYEYLYLDSILARTFWSILRLCDITKCYDTLFTTCSNICYGLESAVQMCLLGAIYSFDTL